MPGRPVLLNEYSRGFIFTDIAFYNYNHNNSSSSNSGGSSSNSGGSSSSGGGDSINNSYMNSSSVPLSSSSTTTTTTMTASLINRSNRNNMNNNFDINYNNNNNNNNNINKKSNVYISSNRGIVLCINSLTDQIICAYQLHTLGINSITIHSGGYTVTGSDDNKLRLWPIDFTDYLIESQHEGCISNIRISNNGRKLAVGTLSGTLGILNISEHSYSTVLRSHIGSVIQVIPRIKGMMY